MRVAGAHVRNPLRAAEPRLRRRPIGAASEHAGVVGRTAPDISHLVGFGILLSAALLIAIGSFGAPNRSGEGSPTAEVTTRSAAVDSQGYQR